MTPFQPRGPGELQPAQVQGEAAEEDRQRQADVQLSPPGRGRRQGRNGGRILHCKTLYQKLEKNIPRNETARARPSSQFLHSCICERFIYSQDRSAYLAARK